MSGYGNSDSRSCDKCGEPGHLSNDCTSGGGGGGGGGYGGGGGGSRGPQRCYNCQEDGHISRDCPSGGGGRGGGGGGGGGGSTCYNFGGEGHFSREDIGPRDEPGDIANVREQGQGDNNDLPDENQLDDGGNAEQNNNDEEDGDEEDGDEEGGEDDDEESDEESGEERGESTDESDRDDVVNEGPPKIVRVAGTWFPPSLCNFCQQLYNEASCPNCRFPRGPGAGGPPAPGPGEPRGGGPAAVPGAGMHGQNEAQGQGAEGAAVEDAAPAVEQTQAAIEPAPLPDLTLAMIESVLQGKNFAKNIVSIPAKVPIIKFRDDIAKMDITLNLNQDVSIRNTQLVRDYAKVDWRFPQLAMMLKTWARENRIASAIDKTISSYSWTLMTIHYLQVCEGRVLEQAAMPGAYNAFAAGVQWSSFLCIEEPFTRSNTTRSVHDKEQFQRILELLRMSSNALRSVHISLFNVIADDIDFPIKYYSK